jgi:ferredoxin/flavodoxin---NADP+ reductase
MSTPRVGSEVRPLRVAVVGAGPAGFYAAEALTKQSLLRVRVDLFERLPVPYGLVRYGVAPDHQKIKSVTRAYDKVAAKPEVRYFGNVRVCSEDLTLEELLAHYDQVVFAVGCETDRRLGIPGEDLPGSHAATRFVAWYNGHPDFVGYEAAFDHERAAVIGVGDVALDLARLMVTDPDVLAKTDIADSALERFRGSRIREVLVIARRGPAQAAFATKELEELVDVPGIDVLIDPADVTRSMQHAESLSGLDRRKLEYLETVSKRPRKGAARTVRFLFFQSPVAIIGDDDGVRALEVEHNELLRAADGSFKVAPTGRRAVHSVGLVLRSVGYRGTALAGVPFDERAGIIPNAEGRIRGETGIVPRLYCAGWIKRGPSGVIGTNKADAAETVAHMLEDAESAGFSGADSNAADIEALLARRGVRVVTFADWQRLSALEVEAGSAGGRPRRKFLRREEFMESLREDG